MEMIGTAVIACYRDIVHAGGKGEIFIGNLIGHIGFCKPGGVFNPGIGSLLLFIIFKELLKKAEVIVQPDAVAV